MNYSSNTELYGTNKYYLLFIKMIFLYFNLIHYCYADSKVKILTLEIPGLHQEHHNGYYDKIINEILIKPGFAVLTTLPIKRGIMAFENQCEKCCISPANMDPNFHPYQGTQYLQTDPMGIAKAFVFTPIGELAIKSLKELKGKNIGVTRGVHYGKEFEQMKLKTFAVKDISQNINKVNLKRIDAFIAYSPDVYLAFKKLGIKPFPHEKNSPIAIHYERLVCKGVELSFINLFNRELAQMAAKKTETHINLLPLK